MTVFQEKILCYDGVLLKRILSSFQSFNLYSKIVSNQKDESLFVTHWTTQHTTNQAFLKSHLKFLYLLAKIVSHIIKLSFRNFFVKSSNSVMKWVLSRQNARTDVMFEVIIIRFWPQFESMLRTRLKRKHLIDLNSNLASFLVDRWVKQID